MEQSTKRYDSINIMRMVSALLVIALHTSIFSSISIGFNDIVAKGISRIAVPFFFTSTGYFLVRNVNKEGYIKKFVKKLGLIYIGVSAIDFLLIMPYIQNRFKGSIIENSKYIFIGGITESLWYIPAIIFAVVIVSLFIRKNWIKPLIVMSVILYIIGLLGDSYFGLVKNTPLVGIVNFYNSIFINTRNGIAFSIPFVAIGALIALGYLKINQKHVKLLVLGFSTLFIVEAYLLNSNKIPIDTNMYISLILLLPVIFVWLLNMKVGIDERTSNILREMSLWVYCIHETIMITLMIYVGFKNTMISFAVISLLSIFIAYLISIKKVKIPAISVKKERGVMVLLLFLSVVFLFVNNLNRNSQSQSAYNSKEIFNLEGEPTDIIGPLYKVSDDNSSIYIYQTSLLGDKEMYPLNSLVQEAVKNSEAIVFEYGEVNNTEEVTKLTMYDSGDSIENHISQEAISVLTDILEENGLELENVKNFKPYMINGIFNRSILDKDSISIKYSSKDYLTTLATEYSKDRINMDESIDVLKKTVNIMEGISDELIKLMKYNKDIKEESLVKYVDIWKLGDVEAYNNYDFIYESLDDAKKVEYKKLKDVIKEEENKYVNGQIDLYMGRIKEYMSTDKNYFVVFSDTPLSGENGMIDRLTREGYKVEKNN